MADGDTNVGDKIKLKADGTFTIVHQGERLKLKLDAGARTVELVSIGGAGTADDLLGKLTTAELLRRMSSPKVALDETLLKKLSRADTLVFANVKAGEHLAATLPALSKLSKDMTQRGASKPLVVLQVPGNAGAGADDLGKTIRTFRAAKHGFDTHVISLASPRRKSAT